MNDDGEEVLDPSGEDAAVLVEHALKIGKPSLFARTVFGVFGRSGRRCCSHAVDFSFSSFFLVDVYSVVSTSTRTCPLVGRFGQEDLRTSAGEVPNGRTARPSVLVEGFDEDGPVNDRARLQDFGL